MTDKLEVMEPAEKRITFARKNDLTKVLKKVEKHTDEAIEFLASVVTDEKNDMKVRIDAAKFIVEKRQSLSESIAKDQLSRTIAESRLMLAQSAVVAKSQMKDISPPGEEGDTQPLFLADVIVDHSKLNNL